MIKGSRGICIIVINLVHPNYYALIYTSTLLIYHYLLHLITLYYSILLYCYLLYSATLCHCLLGVQGVRGVDFRLRVRLARLRNEDEDSVHKLYTLVITLYSIVLYCIILYCIVLYYIVVGPILSFHVSLCFNVHLTMMILFPPYGMVEIKTFKIII